MGIFQEDSTRRGQGPSTYSETIPDIIIADEVERLLTASMSVNTHNTYRTGIQAFEQFRKSQGLPLSWPPLDVHLNMCIAHLSLQGSKHATAKSYISAISYYCKNYYKADPTKSFLFQKLLQGMKRSNPWTDSRLPITFDSLSIIVPKQ